MKDPRYFPFPSLPLRLFPKSPIFSFNFAKFLVSPSFDDFAFMQHQYLIRIGDSA